MRKRPIILRDRPDPLEILVRSNWEVQFNNFCAIIEDSMKHSDLGVKPRRWGKSRMCIELHKKYDKSVSITLNHGLASILRASVYPQFTRIFDKDHFLRDMRGLDYDFIIFDDLIPSEVNRVVGQFGMYPKYVGLYTPR